MHKLMIAAMADASLTHFQRLGHRGQWDACTDCLQRPDSARSFQLLPDCPICQEPMEWLVRKSQELQIYIYTVYYVYIFFLLILAPFFIIRHTFTGKVNSKGNHQQMSTAISLLAGGVTTKEVTTPMVGLATTTVDQGRTNQVREWDGEWDGEWWRHIETFRFENFHHENGRSLDLDPKLRFWFIRWVLLVLYSNRTESLVSCHFPLPDLPASPYCINLYHTISITIYLYHSISPISADVSCRDIALRRVNCGLWRWFCLKCGADICDRCHRHKVCDIELIS